MTHDELLGLVMTLIMEAPDGFSLAEFRACVRDQLGRHLSKREAVEILGHPSLRLTAADDGTFRAAIGQTAVIDEAVEAGSFVVFDIETRGADRQTAQIIQLAALRVEAWRVHLRISG